MCVFISQNGWTALWSQTGILLCSAVKLESIVGHGGSTHFGPSGKSRKGRVNNRITAFAKVVAIDLFNFHYAPYPFGPCLSQTLSRFRRSHDGPQQARIRMVSDRTCYLSIKGAIYQGLPSDCSPLPRPGQGEGTSKPTNSAAVAVSGKANFGHFRPKS